MRIYVDGVQQRAATNPSLGPVNSFYNFAFIGGTNTNVFCGTSATEAFFKGLVDEVQIFRRALTPQEILGTFNAGSAGTCKATLGCTPPLSGMAVWLPGEGNTFDIQGGGGTLNGSATFAPGKVGQAFSLAGNNEYVALPDSPASSITGAS